MKPPPDRKREPSVDLHFRLPAKQYDAAYTQARREWLTVPQWIRKTVRDTLRHKPD
jgi:hypothetical protein